MATGDRSPSWFVALSRERSVQLAIVLWVAGSLAVLPLSHGTLPFPWPDAARSPVVPQIIAPLTVLAAFFLLMGIIHFLTRRRAIPDLAARAPAKDVALRELVLLWTYGACVMTAGKFIGERFFGEGIGLHLNGSLFEATRGQPPPEVWTWAVYNFVLFAVVPFIVFRARGYSREALNLKSANLRNDTLVIVVVLAIMCALDLTLGPLLRMGFSARQLLEGGAISFVVHLLGTGLPVMIFIYAIMLPRYMKLTGSVATTTLLGALSYGVVHLLEFWTVYDSVEHAILSVIFVLLTFVPPGLVKSYLTLRTGNAWVHLWAFHAISPHVTVDTRLIIHDFSIR
ncbi:MAG: hypothetical protein WA002_01255 [Candidatus Acidiferrales bacterium]